MASKKKQQESTIKKWEKLYAVTKIYYDNKINEELKIKEYKEDEKRTDLKSIFAQLCKENNIDLIPEKEFNAKINFIKENNLEIIENNKLNPIFFMSSVNLQATYNISLEELIKKYNKNINL